MQAGKDVSFGAAADRPGMGSAPMELEWMAEPLDMVLEMVFWELGGSGRVVA